jgi:hypothetical protein
MVREMVVNNGGTVTGEIPNVTVTFPTPMGPVAGSCRIVSGNTVNLTVTKKPDVFTCAMVRERLVALIIEAVRVYSLQSQPAV